MATFKTCVRKMRNDGFYPVYIRVTQGNKVGYIKTDKLVREDGLAKKEVVDPFVMQHCMKMICSYVDRLNKHDTKDWLLKDIMDIIQHEDEDVCFSQYARTYIDRMIDRGQERNARNYLLALQHMERYFGTTNIMFSQLTSTRVSAWIETLSTTKRAKEMYPIDMRQIFKQACAEMNDYDRGIMRIKTNPWVKVDIPKSDIPEQQAITMEECREFFTAPLPESKMAEPVTEIGRDVAKLVLCLAGINTIDLYNMQKKDYYDGILHYNRSKTKKHRRDHAYYEMRVPPIIQPLIEKYMAPANDPYLFTFHRRYSSSDSFGANMNCGIRTICKSMGIPKDSDYNVYTFRHTWATIAQNELGLSMSDVGFGMNHASGNSVTRGYVKVDFSRAWEYNEKIIDLIFFTQQKSKRTMHHEEQPFEKFSRKNLMHGTVYFMGKTLGEVNDIGYSNVNEIIAQLVPFVPDDVPNGCIVQFKVENMDKKQTAIYERQKGKSF